MCGNTSSKNWFDFFSEFNTDKFTSKLAVITNACNSCDFFHSEPTLEFAPLFEFIITGSPCASSKELECLNMETRFWNDISNIETRQELVLLNWPTFRFLSGYVAEPTPAELYEFKYNVDWNHIIPTPNLQEWQKIPKPNPTLQEIFEGISPKSLLCEGWTEGNECQYFKGLYTKYPDFTVNEWNLLPVEFESKEVLIPTTSEDEKNQISFEMDKTAYEDLKEKLSKLEAKEKEIKTELKKITTAFVEIKKAKDRDELGYIGEYNTDGQRHGIGEYSSNAFYYFGEWKNDLHDGIGNCTIHHSGNQYIGEWEHGKGNGFGILSDGESYYIGHFKNDAKNGLGEFEWDKQRIYRGNFNNDTKIGYFLFTSQDDEKEVVLKFGDDGKLMVPKGLEHYEKKTHLFQ